jgi:S-adenosylmethionine decarboxylase
VKPRDATGALPSGREWIVEGFGCDPSRLADADTLRALFDRLVGDLSLNPVGEPVWHVFPPPGGVTGLWLLAESHLACHTFPEHGSLCINLFCCTPRPDWDFESGLSDLFDADRVVVRRLARAYASGAAVP